MAIRSGFFNAVLNSNGVPDRVYDANDFSAMFDGVFTDGVYPDIGDEMAVTVDGLDVYIGSGRCWYNGVWVSVDERHKVATLERTAAGSKRIDILCIVVNKSSSVRDIDFVAVRGSATTGTPVAPIIDDPGADIHYNPIARFTINGSSITKVTKVATYISAPRKLMSSLQAEYMDTVSAHGQSIDSNTSAINALTNWKGSAATIIDAHNTAINTLNNWKNNFEANNGVTKATKKTLGSVKVGATGAGAIEFNSDDQIFVPGLGVYGEVSFNGFVAGPNKGGVIGWHRLFPKGGDAADADYIVNQLLKDAASRSSVSSFKGKWLFTCDMLIQESSSSSGERRLNLASGTTDRTSMPAMDSLSAAAWDSIYVHPNKTGLSVPYTKLHTERIVTITNQEKISPVNALFYASSTGTLEYRVLVRMIGLGR